MGYKYCICVLHNCIYKSPGASILVSYPEAFTKGLERIDSISRTMALPLFKEGHCIQKQLHGKMKQEFDLFLKVCPLKARVSQPGNSLEIRVQESKGLMRSSPDNLRWTSL
ncbi:hypothetical protein XELAEV_18014138mg [Xenopus laevis]|uniref:Uncharacterized protein n=1 Tax=Xenopus laevis TaxID=8355 RepID=A0A974HV05_XENLA|nr:hypothetical protein XELAEV_18014138mg [Xenopus laevis]